MMFKIDKSKLLLTLDIQFFADEPPADNPTDPGAPQDPPPATETNPAPVTYTEQDFQTKLKEELAKAGIQHKEELQAALSEAEKLAKMNADEKAKYELEKREQVLTDKEKAIAARELRAETLKTLADKEYNLPTEIIDLVLGADAETTTQNIKAFKKVFDAAVQSSVEERLAGTSPTVGTGAGVKGQEDVAREQFARALGGM